MKKSNFLYTLLFCCMLTLFSSCDKLFYKNRIGHPVMFGATVERRDGTLTRTSYSGDISDGKEKIYWENEDQVSIYMDWDDGSGYTENPEHGIYNVIPGSDFHYDDLRYGRISHADGVVLTWHGDFSGGDGRAHEYKHTFFSAYPSNGVKKFDGTNVTFNIPYEQNGVNMDYAYMTAYAPGVYSNTNGDSHVELHYYPRVTTLYISIENDTDGTVGGEIKLTSPSNKPIAGNYTVSIPDYSAGELTGDEDGTEIVNRTKELTRGDSDIVAFFIRPQTYENGELSLVYNNTTQQLKKVFEPNVKYNIKITVSGNKEPEFSKVSNAIILAQAQKEGNIWQMNDDGTIVGPQPAPVYWGPIPDDDLWDIAQRVVDLDINAEQGWFNEISPDDLNVFPNLKTVKIYGKSLTKVHINNPNITELSITGGPITTTTIEGCNSLTDFYISSTNLMDDITVKNNKNLKSFFVDGPHTGDGIVFTVNCDDCPELETFTVRINQYQNYAITYHKNMNKCPKFAKEIVPPGSTEI